ncbi:MAG: hypothetical protein PVH64_04625, partial [Bacillota bacterium]
QLIFGPSGKHFLDIVRFNLPFAATAGDININEKNGARFSPLCYFVTLSIFIHQILHEGNPTYKQLTAISVLPLPNHNYETPKIFTG